MTSTPTTFDPGRTDNTRSDTRIFQTDISQVRLPGRRFWLLAPTTAFASPGGRRSHTRITIANHTLRLECAGRQKTYLASMSLAGVTHLAQPKWESEPLFLGDDRARVVWMVHRQETGFSVKEWESLAAHLRELLPAAEARASAEKWPPPRSDGQWWHSWTVLPLFGIGAWHINRKQRQK